MLANETAPIVPLQLQELKKMVHWEGGQKKWRSVFFIKDWCNIQCKDEQLFILYPLKYNIC
jgi:hypothetical protein